MLPDGKTQSLSDPPQVSLAFPVHVSLHSVRGATAVGARSLFPQQHWWDAST